MNDASQHRFPALHNAMWPGLVGKGPDSEPPIDLDTMLDLTANASVDGVRFDGVDLFLFDPHVSIDSTDDELKRLADRIRARQPRGRLAGGAGVAADRRRLRDGRRRPSAGSSSRRCGRPVGSARRCARSAFASTGVVRIDSAASPAEWAKDPQGNTKKIAQTFREACDVAEVVRRAARGRRRNLLGRHAQLEAERRAARAGGPAEDARLPGGHGAHAALHARLQRARGSAAARRLRLEQPGDARRSVEDDDARAAAVDDRFSRRAERRDGEGIGIARQDRPPLPAQRSERQAGRRAPRRLLDARRQTARRPARSTTSAGTAACFRTPR